MIDKGYYSSPSRADVVKGCHLMESFTQIDVLPSLQGTLKEKGFLRPTAIQAHALPVLLAGRSLVGVAETGSGKTLSYALPILHQLKTLENAGNPVSVERQPRAVVVVPTRELGEQVAKVFKLFTHDTRLRVRTVLGGTAFPVAKKNVAGNFEVLVATPGRLVQLLEIDLVKLCDVRTLVFDEADQMLDAGFLPNANQIVAGCPADRQLALFSATVSPAVQDLMKGLFAGVEVFRSEGSHRLVPTLTTQNRIVGDGRRFPLLREVLKSPAKGTLIFTNTRQQCDEVAMELRRGGFDCRIYRGEMDKIKRRTNLRSFRKGEVDLLVSTDLAGRGLDVEHVDRVINYHLPREMENYIHRVGRTARAGRAGLVINFVTERDQALVKQLGTIKTV